MGDTFFINASNVTDMNFGYSLVTQYEPDRDLTSISDELIRQTELARHAGFSSIGVSEHHVTDDQYLYNEAVLSYVAQHIGDMSLSTSICLLPYHNPVRIAEFGATLDILTNGSFTLGVGQGYRPEEFDVFGVDRSSAVGRLVEGIDIIKELWTSDSITYDGEFHQLHDVSINPKPIQEPRPRITMGASNESSIRRAARIADGWSAAHAPLDLLAEQVSAFRDEAASTGNRNATVGVGREVYVAETSEEAERIVREPLMRKYDAYIDWGQSDVFEHDDFDTPWEQLRNERFIVGNPTEVIEEIDRYIQTLDPDGFGIRTQFLGMNFEDVHRSIKLLGEEVLPSFT